MPARIVHDPIENPRWAALLDRHPSASIFHTPGWLSALRQTYGYEPFVVTTSPGSTIENGLVAWVGYLDGVRLIRIQRRSITEKSSVAYLAKLLWFLVKASTVLSGLHLRRRYDLVHGHQVLRGARTELFPRS